MLLIETQILVKIFFKKSFFSIEFLESFVHIIKAKKVFY